MKTVRLYGVLGEKFGREFKLDVRTPAEAIKALCAQIKGLRQHFGEFSEPGYIVRVGTESRGLDELGHPSSSKEVIRIIPVTAGSSATARIIIGVSLMVVGAMMAWADGGFTFTNGAMIVFSIGASMTLGGIAELLAPAPPKMKPNRAANATPSYLFDGPVNTSGSGYAVSAGYGEMLIGSHVVSAEFYSVEEAVNPLEVNGTIQVNKSTSGAITYG